MAAEPTSRRKFALRPMIDDSFPPSNTCVDNSDEVREIVGLFLAKGFYRQAENQYLMVPPARARLQTPQVLRLLGYGISRPSCGFYKYQDPMRVIFGVEDEETVDM